MNTRAVELARRQAALRLHCAVQRREIGRQLDGIEARFHSIDRVVRATRGFLLRPSVIAGGVVLLVLLGRVRTFRVLGRGLLLLATARRFARVMQL
jgi:hypothetical protein